MMEMNTIAPFQDGNFRFWGCNVFHKCDRNLLLAGNGCMILLNDELLESLKAHTPSDDLQFKLVQHGLAHVPGKEMFRQEKEVDVGYFIIDITKRCNFDCVYCFRDLHNHGTISFKVLEDTLHYIQDYCRRTKKKKISMQMWGGEPLFAMDRIKYVVEFFRKTELSVSMDVETNASIVTEEMAEQLYQWGIHVGVSLDGPPELQNRQRPLAFGGENSHSAELVQRGLRNLQKFYGDELGGITVVTKYNFRQIKEMLDYFIYHCNLKSMKFNIVRDNGNAVEHSLGLEPDEIRWFAEELLDYLQAYRAMGAIFSEGNVEQRAGNLLRRSGASCCISNGCQGGRRIISFDQEGNIFPCEMTDFPEEKIGSIYSAEKLETQIEAAEKKNLFFVPKRDSACKECPWWCYCRGGCSSRNRYSGNDGQIDPVECTLNQVIYPKLVEWILDGYL